MRIGILGGSFNPVHIGHLRLALEARELLHLDRVDLVPAAVPPHKPGTNLLPFGLRYRLLRLSAVNLSGLDVNLMEARRGGLSYTWDTLSAYQRELPGSRLFFLLGVPELFDLSTWKHGLDLTRMADLVAVARQGMAFEEVHSLVHQYWPGALGPEILPATTTEVHIWHLPVNGRLLMIRPPFLEISSTLIRSYWVRKRSLRFLVPTNVAQELELRRRVVERFWDKS
ncbi:MAG TPA: nicotinate (nicotinamide) nucleotide adenylyltransferase [Desulfonatronum sp.]|nr:nicotinate (nicotinamide) nucleotide adenylyltransferase [Desulfonatronum sp.]